MKSHANPILLVLGRTCRAPTLLVLGSAILMIAFSSVAAAAQPAHATAASESSPIAPRDAFELGYDMGVGSVQASVAVPGHSDWQNLSSQSYAAVSIGQADEIAARINALSTQKGGPAFSQDAHRIAQALYRDLSKVQLDNLYTSIVVLREAHTAVFAKTSPRLANLYVLGVNVGMAEAQATQGDAARPLIEQALTAASEKAVSAGLPSDPLDNVLTALRSGAAMSEVHRMIISARSTYSYSL